MTCPSSSSPKMGFFCTSGLPQHPPLTCSSSTKKVPRLVSETVKRLGKQADAYMREMIPSGKLELVYVSSCAVIFRGIDADDKAVICKVYHESPRHHQLGKIELQAYNRLVDAGVKTGVPQLYSYYDNGRTMILTIQDVLCDGYDFVAQGRDCHMSWMKGIRDLTKLINDMHAKDIMHGDIKLENMAFDNNNWYLIDFAFSKFEPSARLTGTIPQLPPRVASMPASKMTKEQRMEFDYYAFALSMLGMFDIPMYERCPICLDKPTRCSRKCCSRTYIVIEIQTLYQNCRGYSIPIVPFEKSQRYNTQLFLEIPVMVPIYQCLCNIVLSELDPSKNVVVWDLETSSFEYGGDNKFWTSNSPPFDSSGEYWRQLTDLISCLPAI